jgi:hypothetical protein
MKEKYEAINIIINFIKLINNHFENKITLNMKMERNIIIPVLRNYLERWILK